MGDILHGDFEWNETKARYNLRIHGVSFLEAVTVFEDPLAVVKKSHEHSVGEYRYLLSGCPVQVGCLLLSILHADGRG